MGWTVYLNVYKKMDDSSNEDELKTEIGKICDRQFRMPGCEPLWTNKDMKLDNVPFEPVSDYQKFLFYFCKIQSSWNPFLSAWLTIWTAKKIMKKFAGKIYVSIHDDFGYPFEKIENYSYFYIGHWIFITALLTPLWLIFVPLMRLF